MEGERVGPQANEIHMYLVTRAHKCRKDKHTKKCILHGASTVNLHYILNSNMTYPFCG